LVDPSQTHEGGLKCGESILIDFICTTLRVWLSTRLPVGSSRIRVTVIAITAVAAIIIIVFPFTGTSVAASLAF
jgi:hypothetical protein